MGRRIYYPRPRPKENVMDSTLYHIYVDMFEATDRLTIINGRKAVYLGAFVWYFDYRNNTAIDHFIEKYGIFNV
jgi:hypothetical protein